MPQVNEIAESVKATPAITTLFAIVFGAGGFNIYSESSEGSQDAEVQEEFRTADVAQDLKHDELLQMYNDLNLKVALLERAITP